uniref:UPF0669 protein C6orf120 homolog n=1 Tax=Myxine glutinosa TaxID=7769 RepID=UPI00358FB889
MTDEVNAGGEKIGLFSCFCSRSKDVNWAACGYRWTKLFVQDPWDVSASYIDPHRASCKGAAVTSTQHEEQFLHTWNLLQVVEGHVGGGNLTHLRTQQKGRLLLCLETLSGDADLYVSDHTLQPTYEDYALQATTCGLDSIIVPTHFHRPLGISVYGHPSYDESDFLLSVFLDPFVVEDPFSYALEQDGNEKEGRSNYVRDEVSSDDEDSVLWTLFVSLLKIVLEVMA